jgi:acyl-coenzyme A thioesterase 13
VVAVAVSSAAVSAAPPDGFVALDDSHGPYHQLIGPVHRRETADGQVFGLYVEDRHRNQVGFAQGGLLASLVDFAVGRAVRVEAGGQDTQAVTVSLTLDFLSPVKIGDWLEAHTTIDRLGSNLAFADCALKVDVREVLRARAVFAVLG